ncbi:MAG: leucine-rich repeat domain-containing protein, partial [Clostridia bacterium]|nr:leucine-rich repeat domain-containing protein [Clostridia bacterium]
MKKGLSIFLAFIFVVGIYTSAPITANAASVDDLTFELNEDGKSYYVADCSEEALGEIVIPSTYNGLPVTSIGGSAFLYCEELVSITIPDSVTSIGTSAFWSCESLTSITIPRTITSISSSAFSYCSSLTSVYITDLASWCNIDFSDNPLYYAKNLYLNGELITDLIIPENVTEIKDYAFRNCSSLTSITIPDSVTSIGDSAFEYCTSLTSVHITSLASWCNIDFDYYANPLYYAENLYLNGELVTELTIPENITEIKRYAFWGCTSLTSITIPDSVTSIGDGAFYDCTSLTSITIPDSITSISPGAFARCESLTSVTIPDSVTSIGGQAFSYCESLTTITIPDSVTSIGDEAFRGCEALTSVTIPKSVTSVGNDAFKLCDSLLIIRVYSNSAGLTYVENSNINYTILDESVSEDNLVFTLNSDGKSYSVTGFINQIRSATLEIPASLNGLPVTSIGEYAFRHCTSLTSVIIPDTVTNIGEKAFYNCILLENIIISDYVKNIGSAAFSETAYLNNSNNWENDVLYINNYLLYTKDTLSGDYIIKDGT